MTRLVAITGIAGGIGAATATLFHDAGWSVAGVALVDLLADAPVGTPRACASLLAGEVGWVPPAPIFLGVVDPGGGATSALPLRGSLPGFRASTHW